LRQYLSRHSLAVGVRFCMRGQVEKGRRSLARSVRLNPSGIHAYVYLALSLLGSPVFRTVHEMKDRLLGRSTGNGELR
jgi:hypothetical protein